MSDLPATSVSVPREPTTSNRDPMVSQVSSEPPAEVNCNTTIVVMGPSRSGKTTLTGVLTQGTLSQWDPRRVAQHFDATLDAANVSAENVQVAPHDDVSLRNRYRNYAPSMYARLLNHNEDEMKRKGMTMDVHIGGCRGKNFAATLVDTPGDRRYVMNAEAGMQCGNVGLMCVDISDPMLLPTSTRHDRKRATEQLLMVQCAGLNSVVVAVTCMDTVLPHAQETMFKHGKTQIESWFKKTWGQMKRLIHIVPCGAAFAENVCTRDGAPSWWDGPCVLEALEEQHESRMKQKKPNKLHAGPLQMSVLRSFTASTDLATGNPLDRPVEVVLARVCSGMVTVGDTVSTFRPRSTLVERTRVIGIRYPGLDGSDGAVSSARVGEFVALVLESRCRLRRGAVVLGSDAASWSNPLRVIKSVRTMVRFSDMRSYSSHLQLHKSKTATYRGMEFYTCVANQHVTWKAQKLHSIMDGRTGKVIDPDPDQNTRIRNAGMFEATFAPQAPLILERFHTSNGSIGENRFGRIFFHDNGALVAAGIAKEIEYGDRIVGDEKGRELLNVNVALRCLFPQELARVVLEFATERRMPT